MIEQLKIDTLSAKDIEVLEFIIEKSADCIDFCIGSGLSKTEFIKVRVLEKLETDKFENIPKRSFKLVLEIIEQVVNPSDYLPKEIILKRYVDQKDLTQRQLLERGLADIATSLLKAVDDNNLLGTELFGEF